ncbi:iron-containing redox enzyme family protein [Streptomyces palmae]|uniref:Iron-containing redox enzyme family protein n=1 Tax=Streptomyces palmae TaxID=1701085 RepID=A0A4Z0HEF3_9ACTN|nr:iron-containing redox enzyme family protein [Streptomyces palmae]TGB17696.1 iron-containing redox enzyme family protein [Streptomyces palmae]
MRRPRPRGELSAALLDLLDGPPGDRAPPAGSAVAGADPYGDDLQLALCLCYELHYQGLHGVADEWEWDPDLLRFRAALERLFLERLRADVPDGDDVDAALREVLVEPAGGTGVSSFLRDEGELWQLREYAAHRSLYQLKEADPHVWAVPRLTGRAKASLVAVEYDEFGAGRADRVHARLFADLMRDLGLDDTHGYYLDDLPAPTLATVNVMSLLGLHRALRGGLVGHFAVVEATSPPASRRLVQAMERLGAGPAAVRFYAEHVEADAVHEQLVRHDVIGDLLRREPRLAADVAFGVRVTRFLEDRFARCLLDAWRSGRTSLRAPLPGS